MSDPTRSHPHRDQRSRPEDGGVSWRRWILAIAVLLLAIIALQNSQKVEIKLLFVNTETPLIVGLLIAGALGAIIGYVAPMVRRHRRDEHRRGEHRDA